MVVSEDSREYEDSFDGINVRDSCIVVDYRDTHPREEKSSKGGLVLSSNSLQSYEGGEQFLGLW